MNHVYLMTKNKGKIAAAQSVFDSFGIKVKSLDFDVPEIQVMAFAEKNISGEKLTKMIKNLDSTKRDVESTY